MPGDVVPFGKYKGQPVEVLAADRDYCDWLLAQGWFVERYPQVHTLVINNFGEPTETPEHNALQIRLLDDTFRAKCTEVALRFFDQERAWTHSVEQWDDYSQMRLTTPYLSPPPAPQFEVGGMDALWHVHLWQILHTCGQAHPTTLPDRHQSVWEKRPYFHYEQRRIAVECKPLIGDDYPAILRFLKQWRRQAHGVPHLLVLAGDERSQTVPLDQIKKGRKRPKYQSPWREHPETARTIAVTDIHANHAEAFFSALRRQCATFRRKTNMYAKATKGLQRLLRVYWVVHNFLRVHFTTREVPAVALGLLERRLSVQEIFQIQMV